MKRLILLLLPFLFFSLADAQVSYGPQKSLGSLSQSVKKPTIVYEAEYKAVLARGTALGYTLPSLVQQRKQNKLVRDLKTAGLFVGAFDVLYVYATNGSSDFATLNWLSPTQFQCSKLGGIAFSVNQGFLGDGVSAYLRTNYSPSGNLNYKLNDAGRYAWLYSTSTAQGVIDGLETTTTNRFILVSSSVQRINNPNNLNAAVDLTADIGLKSITRTDASNVILYNNKTAFARTAASSAVEALPQCILRSNTTVGASGVSFYAMGKSLNQTQINTFVDILTTYINSL